ncbi:DUF4411 family protein [Pandoraea apista]|uniref:DUF4411 family protein n=1 Tax=Pandoraea apista TaxID=93218 RepID=UPI0009E1B667
MTFSKSTTCPYPRKWERGGKHGNGKGRPTRYTRCRSVGARTVRLLDRRRKASLQEDRCLGTVVTAERLKPNAVKVPNICAHFTIPCLDIEGFMESEGWEF